MSMFTSVTSNKMGPVVIRYCITELVSALVDLEIRTVSNYTKRRNVGFGILSSLNGSLKETKDYYSAIINRERPIEYTEAIKFYTGL